MKKLIVSVLSIFSSAIVLAAGHTVSITATNATCNGACNGTAVSSLSGGVGPFGYSWAPGGQTTTTLSSLCAGTYILTVTDSSDMSTALDTVVIGEPSSLTIALPSFYSVCPGGCTSMVVTPSGGTPPYTYNWFPSAGLSSGVVPNPNVCPATTSSYTVTVMDAHGCMATAVSSISLTAPLTITTTTTPSSCSACDGTASISSVSGGGPPFTYMWTGPMGFSSTLYPLTNLCAGTYTVYATSSAGCTATATAVVSNSGGISSFSTSTTPSDCSSATGSITLGTIFGGTPPYTFSLNYGAWTAITTYTNLLAGSYDFRIQDSNGCITMNTVIVGQVSPPVSVLDSISPIACAHLGGIYISPSGGTPPYTYLWDGSITSQDLTNVSVSGFHSIHLVDSAGCSSTQSFMLSNLSTLHGIIASTPGNCAILPSATANAFGGIGPYTYTWNTIPAQLGPTAVNLTTGFYSCIITDSTGCTEALLTHVVQNCYNIIQGRVYNDGNGNCVQDSGEIGIAGRSVFLTTGGGYAMTNSLGDYTLFTPTMTNTVTHSNPLYSTVLCPATNMQPVNFTTLGDTLHNVDFAVQIAPGIDDLQVIYTPGVARPGFVQTGTLWYKNIGTTVISGVTIDLSHDSILTYTSSIPSGSYSYPNLNWSIGTLNPGQQGYITINYTVPTIASGGLLGRPLYYNAQINPLAGDASPLNNTFIAIAVINGSFDPNEKVVSPAGNILATDSILHYTIRFQNTGTDTAFTIIVKDTLSPFLNPATIELSTASHAYSFDLAYNGEMTWTFNNILLPDSSTNEPASHGFVTFTVKQRPNNAVGTIIDNTGYIYFDFNDAVITNTTVNTVVDLTTDVSSFSTNNLVVVYPNPFNDNTTFVIQSDNVNESYSFEMTDVLGKQVKSMHDISEKQFTVSRNGLQNGIYFYKIFTAEGIVGIGKVIIK